MKIYVGTYSACELIKKEMYKRVSEKSNFPYPPVCPFPSVCNDQSYFCVKNVEFLKKKKPTVIFWFQGNYTIDNLNFDESFYPSALPTGENRITVEPMVDNVSVYGVQIVTNIKSA